ncbi:MAG: J domain-containing protein [Smithellaceae bacterium]|nr:J domain-containing protein [Smithellaceae bacterium]
MDLVLSDKARGKKVRRCLSCGTTVDIGRRKYCSLACRRKLQYKLDVRIGLIKALNVRFATFYFSEDEIVMDMMPYGRSEVLSFHFRRTPGRKPADDFSDMANLLGDIWWKEKRRTKRRHLASDHVLKYAEKKDSSIFTVRPSAVHVASIKPSSLSHLRLSRAHLVQPDLGKIIKNAYRRQAKTHHPDLGGDAVTFRAIHDAYEDLSAWARNPVFVRRRGFVDRWFYDGDLSKWIQPIP